MKKQKNMIAQLPCPNPRKDPPLNTLFKRKLKGKCINICLVHPPLNTLIRSGGFHRTVLNPQLEVSNLSKRRLAFV